MRQELNHLIKEWIKILHEQKGLMKIIKKSVLNQTFITTNETTQYPKGNEQP